MNYTLGILCYISVLVAISTGSGERNLNKMMSFQIVIFMKIWRYAYFRGQASDSNAVQLGPCGRACVKFPYGRHDGR
jgi:hypothetical protein